MLTLKVLGYDYFKLATRKNYILCAYFFINFLYDQKRESKI